MQDVVIWLCKALWIGLVQTDRVSYQAIAVRLTRGGWGYLLLDRDLR